MHPKAHKLCNKGFFSFSIFLQLLFFYYFFYISWNTPSKNTDLRQLPIVSSALKYLAQGHKHHSHLGRDSNPFSWLNTTGSKSHIWSSRPGFKPFLMTQYHRKQVPYSHLGRDSNPLSWLNTTGSKSHMHSAPNIPHFNKTNTSSFDHGWSHLWPVFVQQFI